MSYMEIVNIEAVSLLENRRTTEFDEIGFNQLLESFTSKSDKIKEAEQRAEELAKDCKDAVDEARKTPDTMRIKRVIGTAVSGAVFLSQFISSASIMSSDASDIQNGFDGVGTKMMISFISALAGMAGLVISTKDINYEVQKDRELVSYIDDKIKSVDDAIDKVKEKGGRTADIEKVRGELVTLREKYSKLYNRYTGTVNINQVK